MHRVRRRGPALGAILVLLLLTVCAGARPALAQVAGTNQSIPVSPSPVVRIQVRRGHVSIRTWDRNEVHVEGSADADVRHFDSGAVAKAMHRIIPIFATTLQTPDGPVTLPAETFSVESVPAGDHDAVDIRTPGDGSDFTITIPASAALVIAHVGNGTLSLDNFHNGTFVTRVRAGGLLLRNVSGTGYAETGRGPLVAMDSTFDRIRARSALGNVLFERCNSRQIEVSTLAGNVVYDNGAFSAGLAHFESQTGAIALGVASSDVRIAAHSGSGKVLTSFDRRADVVNATSGDAQATLGGPRTIVTATSASNAVYLYDGSIRNHQKLTGEWKPVRTILNHRPSHQGPPHPLRIPHRR